VVLVKFEKKIFQTITHPVCASHGSFTIFFQSRINPSSAELRKVLLSPTLMHLWHQTGGFERVAFSAYMDLSALCTSECGVSPA